MEMITDAVDEKVFFTREDKREVVIVKDEYNRLNHVQKLELLFTVKNWIADELDKIANA